MPEDTPGPRQFSSFTHCEVRSLAWAIGSAPLMQTQKGFDVFNSAACQIAYVQAQDWLEVLDQDPQSLLSHLKQTQSWKVGYRFEALISFWLNWCPDYEFLGTNLQVQQGKGRTLGAFDYILRNQAGEIEHWEAAIKFYLLHGQGEEWSSWIGPGKRDRLDIKLKRMINHQLPLSATAAGIEALQRIGVSGVDRRCAFIKGMFFRPWNEGSEGPKNMFEPHRLGVWVTQADFAEYAAQNPNCRYLIREKPDWISDVRCTSNETLTVDKICEQNFKRPRLLSQLEDHGEHWSEKTRLFLVPNNWRESSGR